MSFQKSNINLLKCSVYFSKQFTFSVIDFVYRFILTCTDTSGSVVLYILFLNYCCYKREYKCWQSWFNTVPITPKCGLHTRYIVFRSLTNIIIHECREISVTLSIIAMKRDFWLPVKNTINAHIATLYYALAAMSLQAMLCFSKYSWDVGCKMITGITVSLSLRVHFKTVYLSTESVIWTSIHKMNNSLIQHFFTRLYCFQLSIAIPPPSNC